MPTNSSPSLSLAEADVPTARLVIAGATPQDILHNAGDIATALRDLIEEQGLAVSVGSGRKHVEVGGWQAAGSMLGALGGTPLHAETVWSRRVDRDDVIAYESRCEIRTLSGEIVGAAESLCSSEENNWRYRDEYAIKGMAETRAEGRAWRRAIGWVIKLAGYNPTPAEEMPAAEPALPEWAQQAPDPLIAVMIGKLTELVGKERAELFTRALANRYGYTPNIATGFVNAIHSMLSATSAETTDNPEGE